MREFLTSAEHHRNSLLGRSSISFQSLKAGTMLNDFNFRSASGSPSSVDGMPITVVSGILAAPIDHQRDHKTAGLKIGICTGRIRIVSSRMIFAYYRAAVAVVPVPHDRISTQKYFLAE